MASIPILGRRRERRQAELDAAVDAAIEKAMSPAVAMAAQQTSGATYPVGINQSSPFNQVGPGQGFQPLPRPPGVFDSGFGPAMPLFPDAIDPLDEAGRTLPRRAQYLIAANINLIDRRLPWSVLRGLAEDVDVIARCIQLVQDAIVGLDWSWGFSQGIINQIMADQDLTNSAKATAIARAKYGDELQRVQEFFDYPDKLMGFTFSQWLTDVLYSHLVYDGVVIAPRYNLGGELISLSTIDTPTIKILLDNQGFIPQPPSPAYQQILYGFPRGEYQSEPMDRDGEIPNGFQTDQLAYYIRRPHPSSLYGYSQVEECVNIATIYMQRQSWLHAEYSHGVTPKMVITTEGAEMWTPEQLGYYERMYNDQWSGQNQRRQQFMLMRPGMKVDQLKGVDEAYKSDYDAWLVMQMGAKFGIPQSLLGIQMHSSIGGGAAGKQQSDQAEQFATDALRNFLIDCINDAARRFMGVGPELTMTATGGGDDQDDLTRAQADEIDVNAGIRTRNEIRAERGVPLISEPEADQLGITTGTGISFLQGQLAAQQQAAEAAANPPAPVHVMANPDGTVPEAATSPSSSASVAPTSASVAAKPKPKPPAPDNEAPGGITPKDDNRQPDADADAEKELASFAKWARTRMGKGVRDFEFTAVDAAMAEQLNDAVRAGDAAVVKSLISLSKATPTAAGILVQAADTGRVLMVQRSIDNKSSAAGQWEIPGGILEDGENAWGAAQREWTEEVGCDLPKGDKGASWTTPTGTYQGFIYTIPHETDIDLSGDNRKGKEVENAAWWRPGALAGNPAVRVETQSLDWSLLTEAKKAATIPPEAPVVASKALELFDGTPTATELIWPKYDQDAEFNMRKNELLINLLDQRDQAEWAAKAQAQLVDIANVVKEALAPDLERMSAANQQLIVSEFLEALTKAKRPIEVHVEPPPPAEVHVDASQIHHVAAPEVHVAAPEVHVDATSTHTHNVEAPNVSVRVPKQDPNITVNVPPATPSNSKISRDEDGNIVIERSND
jgi:8-oxo-dGTP pyrophosphatase MutT (NUDIX family)